VTAKTRFQQVKLEDLKKILPEQVIVNGNDNHRGNQRNKQKNKQQLSKTSKQKAKA
jgi:hypothetical protein